MRIEENPVQADLLINRIYDLSEKSDDRATGIHVSDLIYCRRKSWYRLNGEFEPARLPQEKLKMLIGKGLGYLLEQEAPETKLQWETPSGTIHGTVDLIEYEDDGVTPIPCEIKVTFYSSNMDLPTKAPHYLDQALSYLVGLSIQEGKILTHCRFYIVFLAGDYKANRQPVLKCFDVYYTPEQVKQWQMELRRRAMEITLPLDPPSVESHYEWECGGPKKSFICSFHQEGMGPCPGTGGASTAFFLPERITHREVPTAW